MLVEQFFNWFDLESYEWCKQVNARSTVDARALRQIWKVQCTMMGSIITSVRFGPMMSVSYQTKPFSSCAIEVAKAPSEERSQAQGALLKSNPRKFLERVSHSVWKTSLFQCRKWGECYLSLNSVLKPFKPGKVLQVFIWASKFKGDSLNTAFLTSLV